MENEKKISPAFKAFLDFAKEVNEASPVREDGKKEYYFYSKKFEDTGKRHSVFGVKDKDGKFTGDSYFVLKGHSNESIKFTVSANGIMKSAVHQNWNDLTENRGPKETFVAKNFDMLKDVCSDKGLVDMAAKFDWSKAPAKEAEAAEVAEEEVIEME